MRLRRSAGEVTTAGAEVVAVETLAAMAADWHGDRLDPDWAPRDVAASQSILGRHGLDAPFWSLTG